MPESFACLYAPVGNRLSRASTLPVLPSATHGYDTNDRLTSDTYDLNGNTLAAIMRDPVNGIPRSVADQYDFEDQLLFRQTTINGQPTEVLLAYDGDGNRVKKAVASGSTSASYFYVLDDLNQTGYPQVVEELQPVSGNPIQLAVSRAYSYGLQLVAQDQLIANQWVASYFGYDGQGSVRFLTDSLGNVTDTYDYDAFGNLIARSGNTPNVYLYRGEQYDAELGLYYLRARYTNPETGRFWTADTFEGFADDPQSLHKYTFNHNDPVNRIDPSGHSSLTELSTVMLVASVVGPVIDTISRGVRHHNSVRPPKVLAANEATLNFIAGTSLGVTVAVGSHNYFITHAGAPFLQAEVPLMQVDPCTFAPSYGGQGPLSLNAANARNAPLDLRLLSLPCVTSLPEDLANELSAATLKVGAKSYAASAAWSALTALVLVAGLPVLATAGPAIALIGGLGAAILVGYGGYSAGIGIQEGFYGFDPWTGRRLSADEQYVTRMGLYGGGLGGAGGGAAGAKAGPQLQLWNKPVVPVEVLGPLPESNIDVWAPARNAPGMGKFNNSPIAHDGVIIDMFPDKHGVLRAKTEALPPPQLTYGGNQSSMVPLARQLTYTAERGLGSTSGHEYAGKVLEGGSGRAVAGHGYYEYGSGNFTVPSGASITLPRDGIRILDQTGGLMEQGRWAELAQLAEVSPRVANDINGMATYLPGASIRNYTIAAPVNPPLTIFRNSSTFELRTRLGDLLNPGVGHIDWAACTE